MSYFDYSDSDYFKTEETIRKTWGDFRSALATGVFSYSELDVAKTNAKFLMAFDKVFSLCHQFFDASIESILSSSTTLMRAGRLRPEDPEPTFSRFIPNKAFITNHNRFSPPGVEWLYLAVGDSLVAENCALKECRAAKGELFGLCQFKFNKEYSEKMLVDLTIAEDVSREQLNEQLENSTGEINTCVLKQAKNDIMQKENIIIDISDGISNFIERITKWAAYTYAKLLSTQIFIPVETDNKELMYSPFQFMAQYFLSLGYEGIIYSSTVFPEGKNMVLFDKDAAVPIGKIKKLTI